MGLFKEYIRCYPMLSPKYCTAIIDEYDSKCTQAATSATQLGNVVLKEHRHCDVLGIKDDDLNAILMETIDFYKRTYPLCNVTKVIDSQFLRYGPGGKFNAHIDSYSSTLRTLSVSVILNDNFNGGEFAFFDKTGKKELHTIKPVQGDIIVFPSNFMYPHAVHPVKFGTRYAIVSWLN